MSVICVGTVSNLLQYEKKFFRDVHLIWTAFASIHDWLSINILHHRWWGQVNMRKQLGEKAKNFKVYIPSAFCVVVPAEFEIEITWRMFEFETTLKNHQLVEYVLGMFAHAALNMQVSALGAPMLITLKMPNWPMTWPMKSCQTTWLVSVGCTRSPNPWKPLWVSFRLNTLTKNLRSIEGPQRLESFINKNLGCENDLGRKCPSYWQDCQHDV